MLKHIIEEFTEGGLAVRTVKITFLGVPIYSFKETSTNQAIVAQLQQAATITKVIKGFST